MNNEYLSDAAWHRVHEALALSMTPASLMGDDETLGTFRDRAATLLAQIGVMPMSAQSDLLDVAA